MIAITEQINPDTEDIDLQNGTEIARMINREDQKVALAIARILPEIGSAIDIIAEKMRSGGRMAYFGSGTSGRIGILDASEMPPTYGVNEDMIQGYISGGEKAVRYAVENAEDREDFAQKDFAAFNPAAGDVVVAISASGNPNYTLKILQLAHEKKILSVAVTSNPDAKFKSYADIFLCAEVGPEVIAGSSRMKSGTAQKMIVNMLSTGAMVRLGKTYRNYMIDVQVHNQKLYQRAINYISQIADVDSQTAENALKTAENVKTACVMLVRKCSKQQAEELLLHNEGILRRII